MVDYFLNQMGVYNFQWYEQNAPHLITTTTKVVDSKFREKIYKSNIGDVIEVRQIEGHVASGRIDIRDSSKEGYDGWDEYAVAPMTQRSWNDFGNWLMELETETVLTQQELEQRYEYETGRKIEYVFETDWYMWDKPTSDYENPM
jgi:hypothetical protein